MILISSCLFGIRCRYDGNLSSFSLSRQLERLMPKEKFHLLVPVCPEVLGGLPVPRAPSEIQNGSAQDVLSGKARIATVDGRDVTSSYVRGARLALTIGVLFGCTKAILKARSPACGSGEVYDGSFSLTLRQGDGILAYLLKRNGFSVFTEEDVDAISRLAQE